MTQIILKIYRTLKAKPVLLYTALISSFAIFILLGSKVRYQEDISKLLPSTNESKSAGFAFNNLKVKDKIFLEFLSTKQFNAESNNQQNYKQDEEPQEDYSMLSQACQSFCDSLLLHDKSTCYIDDITYRIDEDLLPEALSFLFENVPQFIEPSFYSALDSILNIDYARSAMQENINILSAAEGTAYYNVIRFDPLAIRNLFMQKNSNLSSMLGGSYKVIDSYFFTPDSTIALAFLSPNFKAFDTKLGTYLVENIEKEIEAFNKENPQIKILFHGAPIQSVFNSRRIKKDLATTLSFSLLIICIILCLCLRNKSTLILLLTPVIYGSFFALSGIYLIKGEMSLMALGIGAIVLGVALSYCLHVIIHYKYVSNPEIVLKEQTKPVILGSLTTIGAFSVLLFTKSELLSDFGLFASLAMVGTTIFCLIFLPHFFNPYNNRKNEKAFKLIERINTYPYEKKTILNIIVIAIFIISLFTGRNVKFDSNLKNIGYNNKEVLLSQALLTQKTAPGMESRYLAVLSKDLDSALNYNIALEKHCRELLDSGLINKYTNSAMLLVPKNVANERIKCWNEFWNDSQKENTVKIINKSGKEYGFKEEMFELFTLLLNKKYSYTSLVDANIIPKGLMANLVENTDSTYLVFTSIQCTPDNIKQVCNTLVKDSQDIPGNSIIVADPFFYTQNMVELLNTDFNIVLNISSIFVLIVLLLSFRKIIIALIAFLPMVMSWKIVLGAMGFLGLQFNLINIVISTFIFGMGVDYSIFVMDGLLGKNNPKLLVFHKTAIFFSAIVLIIGICSLMFASHPAISSIGLSTLIGMSSTIIITYTVEPFLFNLYSKYTNGRSKK